MGVPSTQASNAILYLSYGAFLVTGLSIAWRLRNQSKAEYLSSNRTQGGIGLSLNFIAASLGSGILFTYPQIATIAGVQGIVVYALSSALPLLIFAALGPIIRKKCPEGFVLTEWSRTRYGTVTALYLSLCTLITLFLYMVAELSALQQIVNAMTGLNGLPAVIVECAVTTIYTSIGGFKVSFITDNIQGAVVVLLLILGVISVGVETDIKPGLVSQSGYLDASLVGWQLIYILPVAVLTNDFFLSSLWLRTFASRTDRDLWIGVSIATVVVLIVLTLVGVSGLLAAWTGAYKLGSEDGYIAFFLLLGELPAWVVGVVLVLVVALSTSAFDSFQSAMVSTGSNDLFRNELNIWIVRLCVVLLIFPVAVVALKSPDVLQIYLISDLVSAALVPVLILGLWDGAWWWTGWEVVIGSLGGILSVFIFGTIYYGSAQAGGNLILLEGGLYLGDWGAFGAFVCAPVGGFVAAILVFIFRISFLFVKAKVQGHRFDALDKPAPKEVPESEVERHEADTSNLSAASVDEFADRHEADKKEPLWKVFWTGGK